MEFHFKPLQSENLEKLSGFLKTAAPISPKPLSDSFMNRMHIDPQLSFYLEGTHDIDGVLLASRIQNDAYLSLILIRELLRKKGLGTLILNYAIDKMKSAEISRVYLDVSPENTGAIRLYERCGFRMNSEWVQLELKNPLSTGPGDNNEIRMISREEFLIYYNLFKTDKPLWIRRYSYLFRLTEETDAAIYLFFNNSRPCGYAVIRRDYPVMVVRDFYLIPGTGELTDYFFRLIEGETSIVITAVRTIDSDYENLISQGFSVLQRQSEMTRTLEN
jgi:hypothetical protein